MRVSVTCVAAAAVALIPASVGAAEPPLVPDPGIRVPDATNPTAALDASGRVQLHYESRVGGGQRVAYSEDGLTFGVGAPDDPTTDVRGVRLHGNVWRRYRFDPRTLVLRSDSSRDGKTYVPDSGVRYRPAPVDRGKFGIHTVFADKTKRGRTIRGVVLLYIGDLMGLNNVRRAYSRDNGWTFRYERGNVMGDADAGGGPNSFVDQKVIERPDGTLRLYCMRMGTIYRFVSRDGGTTFKRESGVVLSPAAFGAVSLHDPWPVRLPSGIERIYIAAHFEGERFAIVSATAR